MEKTAVEYLIEQLEFALPDIEWSNYRNETDKAKEIHKQQIIDANWEASEDSDRAEQYYKNTFKNR